MSRSATKREKAVYEQHRAMFSFIGNRIFFCPKVRVVSETVRSVVGARYDITDDLQPYLKKKYRRSES